MAKIISFLIVLVCVIYTSARIQDVFQMENLVADEGVHWALIVAGSNGWYNYRHQSDACHAYQVLHRHGIPDERIVVMMYDDLADNPDNPTPGQIINHPNGTDVYAGVPKDYTGEDVTPENFLKILQGDKEAMTGIGSGKVIQSGPNDHVFVNFADHGAPGLIAFPDSELQATDLMDAITSMHEKNKYQEMVFYIEACESGSMFKNLLPADISVYATTAANDEESSYACYYDDARDTYLGDVYSVKWMEDSDAEDLSAETLKKQFQIVKRETNTSHVMQYGNMAMADDKVAAFQGKRTTQPIHVPQVPYDAIRQPDVVTSILERRMYHHSSSNVRYEASQQLQTIRMEREHMETIMLRIVSTWIGDRSIDHPSEQSRYLVQRRMELHNFECYEPTVRMFNELCFTLSKHEYALRLLYVLVNMCEQGEADSIAVAMRTVCTPELRKLTELFGKY